MRHSTATRIWRRLSSRPIAPTHLVGLMLSTAALASCGGGDETPSDQMAHAKGGGREEGLPGRENPSSASGSERVPARSSAARGSGRPGGREGGSPRRIRPGATGRSESPPRAAVGPHAARRRESPPHAARRRESPRRSAQLRARIRKAEERKPSERLGCERFSVTSARGEIHSIGPPPPAVTARRVADGVLISYRFGSELPSSETCRPFGLVLTVWSGRRLDPTYISRSDDLQLRGPTGQRVVKLPAGGRPPYRVTVSSVSVTGRSGPRVGVAVS